VILMAGLTCRCTWPDQHEALTVSQPGETDQGAPVTDPSARIVDVLLVEDDPGDVLMTREAFDEHVHNPLDVVGDGAEALFVGGPAEQRPPPLRLLIAPEV
jgi:hypothetical protein